MDLNAFTDELSSETLENQSKNESFFDFAQPPISLVLDSLLKDKTTKKNIIWATDEYQDHGKQCSDKSQIVREVFFVGNPVKLRVRIEKNEESQDDRTRIRGEVFTPIWLCNYMNNKCDEAWFNRPDIFNQPTNQHTWVATTDPICFPEGKTWKDYVDSRRLEVTCGEAPYLVSRYDVATGKPVFPLNQRIGVLDRKLRVVGENTSSYDEWKKWAIRALQSCYGYEWQGDNLLIARINLLLTIYEYHREKWSEDPDSDFLREVANIISWNIWQMDGLNDVVPFGKPSDEFHQMTLFDSFDCIEKSVETVSQLCKIYDWRRDNSLKFKDCKVRSKMSKIFDFVIGNPPYQVETAGLREAAVNKQTPKKNVFHYIQIAADEIAKEGTVLVYPGGRWIQRSGKGLADFGLKQINDVTLSKVYYYPNAKELFPSAELSDGITIVIKNKKKTEPGFDYIYCQGEEQQVVHLENPGENIIPLNPNNIAVSKKIELFVRDNKLKYLYERILPRTLFGIESDFVSKNPGKVREYEPGAPFDEKTELKVLTNDKAGKAGRARWFIVKRTDVPDGTKYIDKWKVIVSSANAGGIKRDNQIEVIDDHSVFGRSRVALGTFETEIEARNFYSYMETYLVRYAFLLTDEALTTLGKKVPDLGTYDKSGLVDYSKDLDQQLFSLLNLNDSEIQLIKSAVDSRRD